MARSTRIDAQWQSALKVELGLRDLGELPLNLGHAGLWTECYSGASGKGLGLRRPPRRRTPLHRLRPSERAEPRFTLENCEFLI